MATIQRHASRHVEFFMNVDQGEVVACAGGLYSLPLFRRRAKRLALALSPLADPDDPDGATHLRPKDYFPWTKSDKGGNVIRAALGHLFWKLSYECRKKMWHGARFDPQNRERVGMR